MLSLGIATPVFALVRNDRKYVGIATVAMLPRNDGEKPPLCKGRWPSNGEDGGRDRINKTGFLSPSQPDRLTAPSAEGAEKAPYLTIEFVGTGALDGPRATVGRPYDVNIEERVIPRAFMPMGIPRMLHYFGDCHVAFGSSQ